MTRNLFYRVVDHGTPRRNDQEVRLTDEGQRIALIWRDLHDVSVIAVTAGVIARDEDHPVRRRPTKRGADLKWDALLAEGLQTQHLAVRVEIS